MGCSHRVVWRAAALVLVALGCACVENHLVLCGEQLCPAGTTCVAGELCADDQQLAACEGLADDAACVLRAGVGRCDRGVCVAAGCGNGVVDPLEACDDGNTESGDGCRADCAKQEVCGDLVVDDGEACDDGNANPADGCDACITTVWQATALLGGSADATSVGLAAPSAIDVDRAGNLYVVDLQRHRIRRIDAITGTVTTVAGTGTSGYAGDGGPAAFAQLQVPSDVAVDGLGNLYIADRGNERVRRVSATGVITTVAGTGIGGYSGDGGPASSAQLSAPSGVAVDGLGNLYIADANNHRIRFVDVATGKISTLAGTGVAGSAGDLGLATSAQLFHPEGVTVDAARNVFIANTLGHTIRRVDAATGIITRVAGGGANIPGDGGLATSAQLRYPPSVVVGSSGDLFIADTNYHRVRRVDAVTGIISTIAGTGVQGYSGDGGPSTAAQVRSPHGVALDSAGNLLIADMANQRIRRIDAVTTIITTIAGTGEYGISGNGGAATSAVVDAPYGVEVDAAGNVYVAESDNDRVRRVDAVTGVISTIAGTGENGTSGDGGPATSAMLDSPTGVGIDGAGNVYVADFSQRVRRVDATTGVITTVAGVGTYGYSGDGGQATSAELAYPSDLAFDAAGNLYIADSDNACVRRVDALTGIITTFAGTGNYGYNGDGGPATSADIGYPFGITIDAADNLYIADQDLAVIRRVDATTGTISTVAGIGTRGYTGDGGAATSAQLSYSSGVAIDGAGDLYIADSANYCIRRVDATTGIITTVAGMGTSGFSGDGGPATSAQMNYPHSVAVVGQGDVIVADTFNNTIRTLDRATGTLATLAGNIDPEGMGPITQARLATPVALAVTPSFMLVAGGASGTVQRATASSLEVVAGRYPQVAVGDLARYRGASFGTVGGVAWDAAANVFYVSESTKHRVHVVTPVDPTDVRTWTIATLAGDASASGTAGFADGAALAARFREPAGLYFDDVSRVLYVADSGNHVIRAIALSAGIAGATVTTPFGTPQTRGYFGDGAAAAAATLYEPRALTRCATTGDFYIADTGNQRVRRVEAATGVITTVLGDGVAASSGEGAPAAQFPVDTPLGVACDGAGNVFVTSRSTVRLLPASIEPGQTIGVVDGSGPVQSIFGAPPRDTFPASIATCLTGVAVVDDQTVLLTDACAGLLIELSLSQLVP